MKVLLVDDSKYMRHYIKTIVTEAGHVVVGEASDGQMGIDLYDELRPDVVFMDITMPVLSGFDSLKGIRQIDPKAVVIMCSAMGQQWLIRDSILEGAYDFVTKPFKADKVLFILSRYGEHLKR
ncbi:MAG TPA: two-component system response regulator [Clostridiales bacterium UBA8960]|nr:two-component system response regulator [Clostridiales bacterium UBA8960]